MAATEIMNDTLVELGPLALAERVGPVEVVYGRWDGTFGCWLYEDGRPTGRHLPAPALLDERGKLSVDKILLFSTRYTRTEEIGKQLGRRKGWEPKPPRHRLEEGIPGYSSMTSPISRTPNEDPDGDGSDLDVYDFDILEKFNTFMELIPGPVRRLAGQFGDHQWLILEAIWTCPRFEGFAERAVLDNSRGYISTCLILAGWRFLNVEERRELIDDVSFNGRRDVLSRLLDREVSNAALNIISKLTPDEHYEEFWDDLFHVLADPEKAKVLAHADKPTPDMIRNLTALPGRLCLPGLISLLDERDVGGSLEDWLAVDDLDDLDDRILTRIRQILKKVRTMGDLMECGQRMERVILEHSLEHKEFPPPPFPGDPLLRPLVSYEALVNEGKQMNNCVADDVDGILSGDSYYFSWHGTERATVEITRQENGMWALAGHLGPKNTRLSKKTSLEIMSSVLEGQTGSSRRHAPSPDPALRRQETRRRQIVRFDYRDRYGNRTERCVRPLLIGHSADCWMFFAWCELRRDFRTFRFDRMVNLVITGEGVDEDETTGLRAFMELEQCEAWARP